MNTDTFFSYLQNPSLVTENSNKELDAVINEFPYFQTVYLLQAKAASNNKSIHYATKLKSASIYATDRIRLYELLSEKTEEVKTQTIPVKIIDKTESIKVVETKVEEKQNTEPITPTKSVDLIEFIEKSELNPITKTVVEEEKIIVEIPNGEEEIVVVSEIKNVSNAPEIIVKVTEKSTEFITPTKSVDLIESFEKPELNPIAKTVVEEEKTIVKIPNAEEKAVAVSEIKTVSNAPEIIVKVTEKNSVAQYKNSILTQQISDILPISVPEKIEVTPHEQRRNFTGSVSPLIEKLSEAKEELDNVEREILAEVLNQYVTDEIEIIEPQINTTQAVEEIENQKETTIDFSSSHSFTEWLHLSQQKSTQSQEDKNLLSETKNINPKVSLQKKVAQLNLIERFIETEPKIAKPKKTEFFNPINKAKESAEEDFSHITETLAKIYLQQGNTSKALKAYEHLSLKFPEKSVYFASQIEKIKEQLKNK